jgi:hypothetical protein
MAYELIALLTDASDLDLDRLARLLGEVFSADPEATVEREDPPQAEGRRVAVRWGGWSFHFSYEDGPRVSDGAREIADAYAGDRPDRGLIASCRRRVVMTADADPGMDRFNDYCLVVQRLGGELGVILFSPRVEEFVDA